MNVCQPDLNRDAHCQTNPSTDHEPVCAASVPDICDLIATVGSMMIHQYLMHQ
jgi:hypothetical protein